MLTIDQVNELETKTNALKKEAEKLVNTIWMMSAELQKVQEENRLLKAYKDVTEQMKLHEQWKELNDKYNELFYAVKNIQVLATNDIRMENFAEIQKIIIEVIGE